MYRRHRFLSSTCQTSIFASNWSTPVDPNRTIYKYIYNTSHTTRGPTPQPKYMITQLCTVLKPFNQNHMLHVTCFYFTTLSQTNQFFLPISFFHMTLQGTFLHRTCHLLAGYEKVQCCSQNPNSERLKYFVWFRPSNGHTWIFPADEVGMEK